VREGRKMSKSLGNFVSIEVLQAYAARYGLDAVRWYLITQGPQGATDADFSHAKFVEVYNAELANGIGNCASRVSNMIEKYFAGSTPAIGTASTRVHAACADAGGKVAAAMKSADTHAVTSLAVAIIREVDAYINDTQPFKLAKTVDQNPSAKDELGAILANSAEAIRIASVLMSPAMPQKMGQLWQAWNCTPAARATLADLCVFSGPHALQPGQKISKGENLFNRADAAEAPPA
jgi:methionyl-tRNA synthetase